MLLWPPLAQGYASFFNDCLSSGLRGCILVELAFRDRIAFEKSGLRKKSLGSRRIVCVDDTHTGDALLDEALKHIKESEPTTVDNWIELLSGSLWSRAQPSAPFPHSARRPHRPCYDDGAAGRVRRAH